MVICQRDGIYAKSLEQTGCFCDIGPIQVGLVFLMGRIPDIGDARLKICKGKVGFEQKTSKVIKAVLITMSFQDVFFTFFLISQLVGFARIGVAEKCQGLVLCQVVAGSRPA